MLQIAENHYWVPCKGEVDGGKVALVVSLVVVSVVA